MVKNKALSVLQTNICSLECNAEKVEKIISNLEFNFDIIAVSERWGSYSREKIKPRIIDGYQTYHGTKGQSRCGFYVKNCLKFRQRTDLDINIVDNNDFQSFWIEIINDSNNILIGCCYKHPRKTSNDVFLEKTRQNINKYKRSNKYIIVCGNFNTQY